MLNRIHAAGKFLFDGHRKFLVKGASYGTFAPTARGDQFPSAAQVRADFAAMHRAGINTVRTYTAPSHALMDEAAQAGLRVMAGIPWSQHVAFLDDAATKRAIRRTVIDTVRRLGDARCKVNLNAPAAGDGGAILVGGTLTQVVSVTRVRASALTQTGNYFELIRFTSGPLSGREYEVREYDPTNKEFILRDPMHLLPAVGNTFTATRRCNRDPADCVRIYANITNNRGYRWITNPEHINRIQRAS